jgi:hypothetical protein
LVYGQATLADAISACVINWSSTNVDQIQYAMIFKALPLSYYDTLIQQYISNGDWRRVLETKRLSEINGYDSATIENATKQALINMPMLEHLPLNRNIGGADYYMVYDRFLLDAYRYASQYGQTSKWNRSLAYQELLATYQAAGRPSLGYNPTTRTTFPWPPRYYDETAETLDSFLKLAGNDAGLWDYIQNHFWNGSIYSYMSGDNMYECEVGFFAFVIGYYYAMSGHELANLDRVFLDLYNKLLVNGWSSAAWGVPGVLKHASSNPQLRLENTLGAILALQAYCGSSTWQSSFADLLSGSSPAWEALLTSPMYSAGRFKYHSDNAFSDDGTAIGMMTLFLEGIIPSTGSLAIPLNDEAYQTPSFLTPASLFSFDYANRTIRIPVNPGELKFQFGTKIASYTFPSTGIYDVQFDGDWNTIVSVNKVGPLNTQFQYLIVPPSAYYPSSLGETSTLAGCKSTFYCDWLPSTTLSGFMLSDNNTGTMVNETWTSFSSLGSGNSWSNFTLILNDTAATIQWLFYANDTDNKWKDPMPLQYMTIRVGIHDIAVTNVVPAKMIVGQGSSLNISVTVANLGDYPETFNAIAYANLTAVDALSSISPTSNSSTTVVFVWNTSSFDEGNYTISAYAQPVPNETETNNNNCTGGVVTVAAHDIAVTSMTFSDEHPSVNDTVTVCVTVQNNGAYTENFTVSVNYTLVNETVIGTELLTLAPEETATLNFTWIPADVALCTVKAYTSEIVGDPSPDDNIRIAYLLVKSPHDVAVTYVACGKTVVCQGYNCCDIDVMVANVGDYAEVFNVTVYVNTTANANVTSIAAFSNVSLNSGNSATLIFDWNTTGFSKGNYTIIAYVWPVLGETDTADNNFTCGWVLVTRVGDLNGDDKCDGRDVVIVARAFGSYGPDYYYPSSPATLGWNPNADINNDDKCDGRDLIIMSRHFGEGT